MCDIIDIFSKRAMTSDEAVKPFPWQDYVRNVRDIQAGFHTLNSYQKGEAMDAVANAFCEILGNIFANKDYNKGD